MRQSLARLLTAVLIMGAALGAGAQTVDAPDAPTADTEPVAPSQLMYREALRSIAEGRNDDASETLKQVIKTEPLHAGAWLDLALIQCSLGHADEAERLFATIETRFNPPPGIVELIADARDHGCNAWQSHSQVTLNLARGIDQNVNQGSSSSTYGINQDGISLDLTLLPEFLPQHDQYSLASLDYVRDISANGSIAFVQLQGRRNDTLNQYNSNSLFAGVETPWRFRDWTLRGSGMIGLVTLGNALYQRQAQVQAKLGPPVPLPSSMQLSFTTAITHLAYLTLDNFDSNTAELGSQLTYHGANSFASASFSFLDDKAIGDRPGGNRHGILAGLLWRQDIGSLFTGELSFSHQTWSSATSYSPGLIDQTRDQITNVWRTSLTYPMSKSQSLKLELRAIHNNENISIFQYNDHQLQLNWQWQGP